MWAVLHIALTQPGVMNQACRAFHSYSIGNQLLAALQLLDKGLLPGAHRQLQRPPPIAGKEVKLRGQEQDAPPSVAACAVSPVMASSLGFRSF